MNAETDFLQAERILRIETPLGTDQLLAEKLSWREGISELFEGYVSVRSKIPDLAAKDVLGKLVDVSVELGGGDRRTWNALITKMIAGPRVTRGLQSYQLVLRPSLWLLNQRSDCRIWLDKSSLEVCETLLGEHGLPAPVTQGIVETPAPQHYSVQWNETDLSYLIRRLEADGIFFHFSHEEGRHVLHLANHQMGYIGGEDVRLAHGSTDRNHINQFETVFSYMPGQRAARDWNFETPGTVPGGATPSLVNLPKNGSYELYEYPMVGGYGTGSASKGIDDAAVERQSKLRMQAVEADHRRVEGASNVRTLAAGGRFTPYDVASPDNTFDPHVILAITHEAVDTSYESVGNQPEYTNSFTALPANIPATPHRATPRPRIDGTQVAIVAGPDGEEIHPDEYGRIKLWFPWDRRAAKDGTDTCWTRVTQNWAGAGWGGQVIPRIGMEVMVTYLDGDPDRPVVTGVVPNARQKVPYDLPVNKTRSTFRTQTHKGEGFNELRFEDENGQEEVYLHSQKDRNEKTENNHSERIDNNWAQSIGKMKASEVGGNQRNAVAGAWHIHVGPSARGMVSRSGENVDPEGIQDAAIRTSSGPELIEGSPGNLRVDIEDNKVETIGTNYTQGVGRHAYVTVGKKCTIGVGETLNLTAGKEVNIVCGASSIKMTREGYIYINGIKIEVVSDKRTSLLSDIVEIN